MALGSESSCWGRERDIWGVVSEVSLKERAAGAQNALSTVAMSPVTGDAC